MIGSVVLEGQVGGVGLDLVVVAIEFFEGKGGRGVLLGSMNPNIQVRRVLMQLNQLLRIKKSAPTGPCFRYIVHEIG